MDLNGVPSPDNEGLESYIRRISDIPLLTREEEDELRDRLGCDDPAAVAAAKKRMIESQLRLVISLARRYQGSGLSLLDLIDSGNVGLVRALERFEPAKPYSFSSWATWWIRQAIVRAVADPGGPAPGGER